MSFRNFFRNVPLLITAFASLIGIAFGSWVIERKEIETEIVVPSTNKGPVCYTLSDNQQYASIEKGVEVANSRSSETVVVSANSTINSNLVIDNGTTLLLPYNDSRGEKEFLKTGSISKKYQVVLASDKTITIENGGVLTIGGQLGTRAITGAYSELVLGTDSNVIVNGICNVYGKIVEDRPNYGYVNDKEIIYDNSNDPKRYVQVNSSGNVVTGFASYDISGSGSALKNQIEANICPTYDFDFPNMQTYVRFLKGAKLDAYAYVSTASGDKDVPAGLIGSDTSEKRLFYLTKGEIDIEYCGQKKTTIYIDGEVNVGSLYLDASVVKIDTTKMYLPFGSYLKIFVNGIFNTNSNDIKFLPGSFLKILDGASFNIYGSSQHGSKVIFYDDTSLTSIGIKNYGNTKATFINNGNLILNEYAGIAGYIATEKRDGSSKIDLSKVSDKSLLTLSTKEGIQGEKKIPTLKFYGDFAIDNNSLNVSPGFFESNEIYSSYIGDKLWNGNFSEAKKIRLTVGSIDLTDFSSEGFMYSVYSSSDNGGSNLETLFENIISEKNQTIVVEKGKFIKVIDGICGSIKTDDLPYDSGTYVACDGVSKIEITPSPAYLVKCEPTNAMSGAGTISRSISYGKTSSSLDFKASTSAGESIQAVVPKGWSFKVSDGSSYLRNSSSKIDKTTYSADHSTQTSTIATKTSGQAWKDSDVFTADADYDFVVDKIYCLDKGSKILMADGSYKNIEELNYQDEILVWDFFAGAYKAQKIAILVDHGEERFDVLNLNFSNGYALRIIGDHGLFDYDLNKFVYIDAENYSDYLGHRFAAYENGNVDVVVLSEAFITTKITHAYSITSAYDYNAIADGLLTSPPPGEFYNWVSMAGKMRYDVEQFNADVERYGLYDYSVFEPYGISYETFLAFNGQYLKIPVEKGIFSFEYIINLFNTYKGWLEV